MTMRRIGRHPLFIVATIFSASLLGESALAEWISLSNNLEPREPTLEVLKSDAESTIVKLTLYGLDAEKVTIEGEEYTHLTVPGLSETDIKGYPEVPRISRNFLIPSEGTQKLRIISLSKEDYSLGIIAPSKGSLSRNINPDVEPYTFSDFYSDGDAYPSQSATLDHPFTLRSAHGVTINLFPVQYSHQTRMTTITREITIELTTISQTKKSTTSLFSGPRSSDDGFNSIYQRHFANYQLITRAKDINPKHFIREKGRLLIISHPTFVNSLAPFIAWKKQTGFWVKVATTAEAGTGYQQIANFIKKEYTANDIGYVVLVGDAEFIPAYEGTDQGARKAEADPMYALVAGNDTYPDLFVSRISVKTPIDVENIVTKIINYEKTPDLDGAWYNRATGIASSEGNPSDKQRAEILRTMLEGWHYANTDKIYDPGATTTQLTRALNEGRSFINYLGHGDKTSWVTSDFSNAEIDGLRNGSKLPFIVSVACINGKFGTGSDSFAERWLKAGSASDPRGAIAILASSINQAWVPPTIGQKEIVNILTKKQATTIGGIYTNGVIAILEDNADRSVETFQTWHTFGDASLQVRTAKPVPIQVAIPEILSLAHQEIRFEAGELGIALGMVQDGELVGSAVSDEQGILTIKTSAAMKPGEVLLTFTGFDKIPLIRTVVLTL